jgi:hypothetical protein
MFASSKTCRTVQDQAELGGFASAFVADNVTKGTGRDCMPDAANSNPALSGGQTKLLQIADQDHLTGLAQRTRNSCLLSRDQVKLKIVPSVEFVICLGGRPSTGWLWRLETPFRLSIFRRGNVG